MPDERSPHSRDDALRIAREAPTAVYKLADGTRLGSDRTLLRSDLDTLAVEYLGLVEQFEAAQQTIADLVEAGNKLHGMLATPYGKRANCLDWERVRSRASYPAISPEASEEETTAGSDGTVAGDDRLDGSAERLSRPATSSSEASDPAKCDHPHCRGHNPDGSLVSSPARSLEAQIEERRNDSEFQERLARSVEENGDILDKLAEGDSDPASTPDAQKGGTDA